MFNTESMMQAKSLINLKLIVIVIITERFTQQQNTKQNYY